MFPPADSEAADQHQLQRNRDRKQAAMEKTAKLFFHLLLQSKTFTLNVKQHRADEDDFQIRQQKSFFLPASQPDQQRLTD